MTELKDLIGNGALVNSDEEIFKIIGITEVKSRGGVETLIFFKDSGQAIHSIDISELDGNYDMFDSIEDAKASVDPIGPQLPVSEAA